MTSTIKKHLRIHSVQELAKFVTHRREKNSHRYTLFATVKFRPRAPAFKEISITFGFSPVKETPLKLARAVGLALLALAFPFPLRTLAKKVLLSLPSPRKSYSLLSATVMVKSASPSSSTSITSSCRATCLELRHLRLEGGVPSELAAGISVLFSSGILNRCEVSCRLFADI